MFSLKNYLLGLTIAIAGLMNVSLLFADNQAVIQSPKSNQNKYFESLRLQDAKDNLIPKDPSYQNDLNTKVVSVNPYTGQPYLKINLLIYCIP